VQLQRSRWTRTVVIAAGLVIGILGAGCDDSASTAQCEKVLDHVIELEIAAGGGGKALPDSMKADLAKQKMNLAKAHRDTFVQSCTKNTPAKVAECSLAARTLDEYAQCERNK
jgi:hypothetical protein